MDIIIYVITLLNDNLASFFFFSFFNYWVWSVVVLGDEFILLLLIGVMVAVVGSELRGGCFWEVYNVLNSMLKSIGDIWFGCFQKCGCFSEGLYHYFSHYVIIIQSSRYYEVIPG